MPKRITIFGATGQQGGSVLHSLSQHTSTSPSPFTLRALTRNPLSPTSQSLSSSGIEVVKADGWDKQSLITAFSDTWAVFANTNSDDPIFGEGEGGKREVDLGRNIVDAAVEAGVKVLVWSGMGSATEASRGKVAVDAFDDKHAIGQYAQSTNAFQSVIIISAGWYFENFLNKDFAPIFGGFPFFPSEDGTLVFRAPKWGGDEDVPFIGMADDFGDIVHGILLEPERWDRGFVQGVSDVRGLEEVVKSFERVTGKKSRYEEIPWTSLETFGIRGLEIVKGMFGFCQESGGRYYGVKTENETAAELKRKGAEARGKSGEELKLLTLEKWFEREFGSGGAGQ